MINPQQKTWTMKHPALAKAFAVAFAVMSLVLLFAGISGIGKAQEDNEERQRYEKRYQERIENYVDLCKQLEGSVTYDEIWSELEEEIEQHDDDASQHRTDLQLHSAEKGGYTMGANTIYDTVNIQDSKRQLAIAKQQLEAQEANIALLRTGIDGLERLKAASASCDALLNQLSRIPEPHESDRVPVFAAKPSPTAEPTPTPSPTAEPTPTPTPTAEATPTPTPNPTTEATPTPAEESTITSDVESDSNLTTLPNSGDGAEESSTAFAKKNVRVRYSDASSGDAAIIQGVYYGAKGLAQGLSAMDINIPVTLPDGPAYEQAKYLAGTIGYIKQAYDGAYAAAEAQSPMSLEKMKAALAAYEKGVAALKAGEKGIDQAQGALENIWYELGQLDEEHEEFSAQRDKLDADAARLAEEKEAADALHELENDRVSAKLLLTSVKEVNDMVEAGGEIVPSAEKYLEDYKAQTDLQHKGWLASCIMAIIGGLAGLAAIPAVYELCRKRQWLIVPAVVSVVCAAAAEAVYKAVGLGWWYVGMFAAIIGLLHLLIVVPQEKRPANTNNT